MRLSIGEFSLVTSLSIKSLRLYQERGILIPAEVDPSTGYRYYDDANHETARSLRVLREFDFSLVEIKELLDECSEEGEMLPQLEAKLRRAVGCLMALHGSEGGPAGLPLLLFALAGSATAQAPSNDLCPDATPLSFGVPVAGTTLGATFDTGAAARGACEGAGASPVVTAPGVWYSVVGTDRLITVTTCSDTPGASATYDTQVSVYCAGCTGLACIQGSDDDCAADATASTVTWCSAAGEEYLVLVHGSRAAVGDFQVLAVQGSLFCRGDSRCVAPPAACEDSTASVIETEPDCGGVFNPGGPGDTTNGGCDAIPPAFTSVTLGDDACASTGATGTEADGDWYELVLSERTRVTACVEAAEVDLELGLVDSGGSGDCTDAGGVDPSVVAAAGMPECLIVDLTPGTWWFRVAPLPGAFVACGAEYTLSVEGVLLGEPGGCCDEASGGCVLVVATDCAETFLGEGSDCSGCLAPRCLYRATAPVRDVPGLFVSPRAGNGIAFAAPFDLPHVCPFDSGGLDPDRVLGSGAHPLAFYQVDDPAVSGLRVEKVPAGETLRVTY